MRVVVHPAELAATAARICADAASLDVLLVVARLEAAANAAPGSELAAVAQATADTLRSTLLRVRLAMRMHAGALRAAVQQYDAADQQGMRPR